MLIFPINGNIVEPVYLDRFFEMTEAPIKGSTRQNMFFLILDVVANILNKDVRKT